MTNPRVQVRMSEPFYAALLAFAAEQDRTPANVLLHAAKGYLSRYHAQGEKTQRRPVARTRTAIESGGPGPVATAAAETEGRDPGEEEA